MITVQEQLKNVAAAKALVTGLETDLIATAMTQGGTKKTMLFWMREGGNLHRYRIEGMAEDMFVVYPAETLVKMLELVS